MEKHHKGLTAVQLAMMALGTVVGGSFFLGSAVAIRSAGPSVIISYIFGGFLVYFILFALSEMTVADPEPGSFRTYAERAFGTGLGFVVGWVYWTGIVLAMSSEAIAISVFLRSWLPGVSLPIMGSIIIIIITGLNLLGAEKLSKLESGLAAIKLLAIVGFIVLGVMLIFGIFFNGQKIGSGALSQETWFPGGFSGIAGSMLIVMFTYAGFEIIGLAASETDNPHNIVPKAISYTVISLVGLYVAAIIVLLPLIPTSVLTEERSPMVLALSRWNLGWAGGAMNAVLITAIFSTMLAAMFGLGRMIKSLADEGHGPTWLKDNKDIPYRGILFSGAAMLVGLFFGFVLPKQVYIFLVSSGGFSLLFTYLIILVTHKKFRKKSGCLPKGKCQLPGYPYTSWIAILSLIGIIVSMPLVPGQGYGLIAGIILILLYLSLYLVQKHFFKSKNNKDKAIKEKNSLNSKMFPVPRTIVETSEELTPEDLNDEKNKK
ncbi:amino acid permease [Sporosalibacterium faouarense]|uniref:amino acid permease n=1 Tax=Sporosalibacterium faouarense TaxID=516123 RepID=UPI00192C6CE5|nr:amino acid permease [Sporosalibacterium faouarense]